jgi:alpha-D-xyloside xylohydrolase
MMRAMVLEFPEDECCSYLDKQYMLGDSLLVAPIFNEKGIAKYYVPAGKWTNFLTGEIVEGGRWYNEFHNYMSIPLLAAPNSLIVTGSSDSKVEYDFAENATVSLFQLEDNHSAATKVYDLKGTVALEVSAARKGNSITISYSSAGKPWTLNIKNINEFVSVKGASIEIDGKDLKVIPEKGNNEIVINF